MMNTKPVEPVTKIWSDKYAPSNKGKSFTDPALRVAVKYNNTLTDVAVALRLKPSGPVNSVIKQAIRRLKLDTKHFKSQVGRDLSKDYTSESRVNAKKLAENWLRKTEEDLEKFRPKKVPNFGHKIDINMSPGQVNKTKLEQSARLFLEAIGEDANREGLRDTPKRYAEYIADIMNGNFIDVDEEARTFDNDEQYTGPVVIKDLPFYTFCEHHLAPFIGTWDIAYQPEEKIIGLSKVVRIARKFQKQPQVQERLTQQIANKFNELVSPKWVVVRMEAEHFCMSTRGVRTPGSKTQTRAIAGSKFGTKNILTLTD